MAEVKRSGEELLRKLTGKSAEPHDDEAGLTREHRSNAQAFALSVVFKDRRRRHTFPWSMYGGHEWTDDGDIDIEILGEAKADAGNLASLTRPDQTLAGD